MRNNLKTKFWRNAAARLPAASRARYIGHLEVAERWELALDALIEVAGRAKTLLHVSHARSA